MNKKVRKLTIPLTLVLLTQTAFPAVGLAAESQPVKLNFGVAEGVTKEVSPAPGIVPVKIEVSLEKAINLVKTYFEVPAEFTEFTSGYNSYNERQTWQLDWRAPGDTGGNFNAQVDVSSGEIVSVSSWKPIKSGTTVTIPNYSYDQAKDIAAKLVQSILSDRLSQLKLVQENTQIIPISDYGSTAYNIQWKRVAEGVPFLSNGVSVTVNSTDGSITGYNLNWSKMSLPDSQGVIGEAKAREVFESNKLLELQYFLPPVIRILDSAASSASDSKKAQLIYQLNNRSMNGIIDAKTGEPLKLNPNEWLSGEDLMDVGGYGGAMAKSENAALTPAEQQEVDTQAQLLTQEQAIEALKKWVEIQEGVTLRNASLTVDTGVNQVRAWNLDWSNEGTDKTGYQYVYGRINAVSGEVLSFSTSAAYRGDEKGVGRTAAQATAEEFLKKIQPGRVQDVKLLTATETGQAYPEEQLSQDFQFQRVVNGIPFPNNGITISVDTVSNKVSGYTLNWSTLDFPASSEAMSQSQANATFLAGRPLTLKYIQIYKNGLPAEIRLVYQPKTDNSSKVSNRIDAKTGKFLDWDGKPLTELPRPYTFTDISGNFAEKEISLLGQAGAFGEYGDQFKPNENITVVSMLRAMLVAKNGAWSNQTLKDEDVIKQAKELGWWQESLGTGDTVSRELQAKLVIRMLQLEKIAQMEELFQAPYQDSASFSEGSLGYIALAKGLGVISIDGANFDPSHQVSRAEAAFTLVKTLGTNTNR